MSKLLKIELVHYPIRFLYELIMDIEAYPEFVPFCAQAKIISKALQENQSEQITAELTADFKGFINRYTSVVTHDFNNLNAYVSSKMLSGPLEQLYSKWSLSKISDGQTKIEFQLDFQFKSFVLENLSKLFLSSMADKIMLAFLNRAKFLYEQQHQYIK